MQGGLEVDVGIGLWSDLLSFAREMAPAMVWCHSMAERAVGSRRPWRWLSTPSTTPEMKVGPAAALTWGHLAWNLLLLLPHHWGHAGHCLCVPALL